MSSPHRSVLLLVVFGCWYTVSQEVPSLENGMVEFLQPKFHLRGLNQPTMPHAANISKETLHRWREGAKRPEYPAGESPCQLGPFVFEGKSVIPVVIHCSGPMLPGDMVVVWVDNHPVFGFADSSATVYFNRSELAGWHHFLITVIADVSSEEGHVVSALQFDFTFYASLPSEDLLSLRVRGMEEYRKTRGYAEWVREQAEISLSFSNAAKRHKRKPVSHPDNTSAINATDAILDMQQQRPLLLPMLLEVKYEESQQLVHLQKIRARNRGVKRTVITSPTPSHQQLDGEDGDDTDHILVSPLLDTHTLAVVIPCTGDQIRSGALERVGLALNQDNRVVVREVLVVVYHNHRNHDAKMKGGGATTITTTTTTAAAAALKKKKEENMELRAIVEERVEPLFTQSIFIIHFDDFAESAAEARGTGVRYVEHSDIIVFQDVEALPHASRLSILRSYFQAGGEDSDKETVLHVMHYSTSQDALWNSDGGGGGGGSSVNGSKSSKGCDIAAQQHPHDLFSQGPGASSSPCCCLVADQAWEDAINNKNINTNTNTNTNDPQSLDHLQFAVRRWLVQQKHPLPSSDTEMARWHQRIVSFYPHRSLLIATPLSFSSSSSSAATTDHNSNNNSHSNTSSSSAADADVGIHRTLAVQLMGGLGNQLWQAAAGLETARKTGMRAILVPPSPEPNSPKHVRPYTDSILRRWESQDGLTFCRNMTPQVLFEDMSATSLPTIPDNATSVPTILYGHFQKPSFLGRQGLSDFAQTLALREDVAICIRRGDFIFHDCALHLAYYIRAARLMTKLHPEATTATVFTHPESLEWVRLALIPELLHSFSHVRVDTHPRTEEDDFVDLRNYRLFIMSNSTFHWWGMVLSLLRGNAKLILYPRQGTSVMIVMPEKEFPEAKFVAVPAGMDFHLSAP